MSYPSAPPPYSPPGQQQGYAPYPPPQPGYPQYPAASQPQPQQYPYGQGAGGYPQQSATIVYTQQPQQ